MFLKKILGLFLRTGGKKGNRDASQGGQRKVTEKLSSCIWFTISMFHRDFSPDEKGEARALMA